MEKFNAGKLSHDERLEKSLFGLLQTKYFLANKFSQETYQEFEGLTSLYVSTFYNAIFGATIDDQKLMDECKTQMIVLNNQFLDIIFEIKNKKDKK